MRVKCLALELVATPQPGLRHGLLGPESSAVTIRPRCLPKYRIRNDYRNEVGVEENCEVIKDYVVDR